MEEREGIRVAVLTHMTPTTERIYAIVARIPKGCVATYGDIARWAGVGSPRVVGSALHQNTEWKRTPCHRVVNAAGRLAPAFAMGGARIQEARLRREGVTMLRAGTANHPGIVDLAKHRWNGTRVTSRT